MKHNFYLQCCFRRVGFMGFFASKCSWWYKIICM